MSVLQNLQQKIRKLCTANDAIAPFAEFLDDMPVPDRLSKLLRLMKTYMNQTQMQKVYLDAMDIVKRSKDGGFYMKLPDDMRPLDFLDETMKTAQALTDVFGGEPLSWKPFLTVLWTLCSTAASLGSVAW
jgi:hypothetical protein